MLGSALRGNFMKKLMLVLALIPMTSSLARVEIQTSKSIKKELRTYLDQDFTVLDNLKLNSNPELERLLNVSELNSKELNSWLNQRVHKIIEENAFSLPKLLIKKVIKVEAENVSFPNENVEPYSMASFQKKEEGFTVMSNVGTALYYGGKKEKKVYQLKVSNGLLKKATSVSVTSPRTGIIQVGEGLFMKELSANEQDPMAYANSLIRIATFFHEARHSDGNGTSLGFTHAKCPVGHDYENMAACDENLNGPYTIGSEIMKSMQESCGDKCSEKEKEILKLVSIDSASRILKTTHKKEAATNWDETPESL